ncbi:MAG: RNA polymerase [Cytophagaceae bacterium]|nr:RNA polymerase [Cytophagaceae bacterium]
MTPQPLKDLLQTTHKEAYIWAKQCCRFNEEEAKDVLQVAYLKIMEGKARYDGRAAFKTWLFSIIRFTAIDHFKNRKMYAPLEVVNQRAIAPDVNEDIDRFRLLLARLPDRQREVLVLAFYHDMTLAAIADTLDLHIGTIRTHYERGKATLRTYLVTNNDGKRKRHYSD